MSSLLAQERVKAGAELLDQRVPDWRSKINLDNLDMSDCLTCILGQVYGEFQQGIEDLIEVSDVQTDWECVIKYGFDLGGKLISYQELHDAWVEYLNGT